MYIHGLTLPWILAIVQSTWILFMQLKMHTTRVFKSGKSQAVRIPADLPYERNDIEVEIERVGDEIRIRPARRSLDPGVNVENWLKE